MAATDAPDVSRAPRTPRALGAWHAALITVGAMVGSGIFATPADVARRAGTARAALAVWAAGGVVSLLGALSLAELGAALPASGGLYVFLRRAYGPLAAFLFGWAMLVVLVPSSVGFYAQVTAAHLAPAGGPWRALAAVALVALVAAVNVAGVRRAAALQSVTAVAKFLGLAVAGAAALVAPAAPDAAATALAPARAVDWAGAASALVPALWAYDGWIDVTSVAGEVRDPARAIPRALVGGTLAVTALYLVVVAGYDHALGPALATADAPGRALGARLAGDLGARAMAALVALSAFGGCVIGLLTGTRVIEAMGADGTFVRALGTRSARGTPDRAVVVTAALAALYVLVPAVGRLGDVFVVGAWPFYAAGALATVALRRRAPTLPRPFLTPAYPWPIVGFVLASAGLLGSYALREGPRVAASLGLVAAGAPVYLAWRRLSSSPSPDRR